jgi:hypothetical protein
MTTGLLPQITIINKIAGHLSHSFNAQAVRSNVLPVMSQIFKDNLLFSGPEMELMAIFLVDYKNTAVAAVQSAYLYTIDQFKSKPAPNRQHSKAVFNSLQPCI